MFENICLSFYHGCKNFDKDNTAPDTHCVSDYSLPIICGYFNKKEKTLFKKPKINPEIFKMPKFKEIRL